MKSILVATSDHKLLHTIRSCFPRGYRVDGAFTKQQAIESLADRRYDLIFVDIRLPEIDGFVIATKLRDSGNTVPLIAVTAVSLEGIEHYAKAVGYNLLLQKPITEEMIENILYNNTLFQSK